MPPTHTQARGRRALCAGLAAVALAAAAALPAQASAAQTAAIQVHLMWSQYDAADRERQLDLVKAAGADMARVDVGWASLELDGKNRWNGWYLDKLDHVVREAEERGIRLLLTFWETPCWASSAPASLKQGCSGAWWDRGVQRYPPANASDYADALAWVVRRYRGRVAAWEIWNEPNQDHYFRVGDRVGSYAALLRAAYPAAKAADRGSTIVGGSLSDADYAFTDALLARGAAGNFDAWSVHPYGEDRSPLHPGVARWEKKSMSSGVPRVRAAMLRHGQDKPLWLTELGWSTCSVRHRAAYENCVDQPAQARYLREAYTLMRDWPYVRMGVWFNLQDMSPDSGARVDNYGLLTHAGAEKPAFGAFRAAAQALRSRSLLESPSPIPTPGSSDRPGPRPSSRALRVRASRRQGRLRLRGRLPVGRSIRVRVHRWKRHASRFSRRVSYRAVLRVRAGGRFRASIASPRLHGRRLLVVVRNRRKPALVARTTVR
jgi:hypothetical protein